MKLTEGEKLKYWVDAEFSILHTMFGIIMFNLTDGGLTHVLLGLYIAYSLLYAVVRASYVAKSDSDFLRVPKR